MSISIVSYKNFSKSVGNYIVSTGAGEFNLPREDMDALYGPSWPIAPVTRPEDSDLPREFDYPVGINYTLQPRVGYEGLMPVRALKSAYINVPEVANPLLMLIRESCAFTPQIRNKKTKQMVKAGHPLLWMTTKPDGETPFNVWLTRLKKSSKIYAAPALYKKRDDKGNIIGLEYIDGSTFFLIVNSRGKLPNPDEVDPELEKYVADVKKGLINGAVPFSSHMMKSVDRNSPAHFSDRFVKFELNKFLDRAQTYVEETGKPLPTTPAFTQIIKGLPFSFWDKNQIYFVPEPPTSSMDSQYGESYIERAWPSISLIALLWAFELGHYRTGNMPEGLITISKDIAPSLGRLATIEKEFNARMAEGTQTQHSRVRFMFDGSKWFQTKRPDFPKEQYSTANHNILLALGMPPKEMGEMPTRGLGGKGFEEGASHDVTRQILEADKRATEDIMNSIMQEIGETENEFYLDYPVEEIDPSKQREQLDNELIHGEKSLNDVMTEQDKQPIGNMNDPENPANWHIVYMGGVAFVMEKLKIDPNGIAMPQLTAPKAGGSPANPETVFQENIGRGHNPMEDQKLLNQTRQRIEETAGKSFSGVTYSLPTIQKEVGVGAGYGGYNLEGNKKDGIQPSVDAEEFAIGLREEQEHADTVGGNQDTIRQIVLDHLREDPKYYTHLRDAGMVEKRWVTINGEHVFINSEGGMERGDFIDYGNKIPSSSEADKQLKAGKVITVKYKGTEYSYRLSEHGRVQAAASKDRVPGSYRDIGITADQIKEAWNNTYHKIFDLEMEKRYKLDGDKVINEDTGKLVPGGDHTGDHDAAVAHLRALYANVPDARKSEKLDDKPKNFMKVDWGEYFKHCGVCPEDAEYFGAPIEKTNVDYPNDHHANKNMEWVAMKPEGLKPLPALWKAEGDEKESLNEKIGGHQCPREEVAWLIDQSLGFHLVPVAYTAELDGERGVVLWYVDGPPATDPKPAKDYAPEWIEKIAVLDYIISNLDRPASNKNRLTNPDDPTRVVAIDNGFSLPIDKALYTVSIFATLMLDKPLSANTLGSIKLLLGDYSTWRDVQDVLTDWDGKESANAAIAKAKECAQRLLDEKSITSYEGHHHE